MKYLAIPIILLATACTVGPDYEQPAITSAPEWLEPADTRAVDPRWWNEFGDPQLVALIDRALESAPDLAEATARLDEARANRDAARGGALPQVSTTRSTTYNRISENGQIPAGQIPGFETEFGLFDAGFDASWEVDFWGHQRRMSEGSAARLEAALAGRREAMVLLTGEIARSYMDLRGAQAEADAARNRAEAMGELARLAQLRFEAGEAGGIEASQARAEAQAASAAVPPAEAQAAAAAYRIAALIGDPPEEVVPDLLASAPVPDAPETILAGIRSDLLRRRPDVQRAERELAAATADVGVATANLFPRFTLMGSIGQQSRSSGELLDSGSTRFSIGPSVYWPIFSGGRVKAQLRAADARADGAAARYEKAVVGALADSESAVNRFLNARVAEDSAQASLGEQQTAFALSQSRYRSGEDDKLAFERARGGLIEAQRRAAQSRAETARAAVSLFKALGGAWMVGEPMEEVASASAE